MNSQPQIKKGLYVITDCERLAPDELLARTGRILQAGVAALQYRDKTQNESRKEIAAQLQEMCRQWNTLFIVNDNVELAKELQADGVHIGRDDGDPRQARATLDQRAVLGLSCYNNLDQALEAQAGGVDYVAFGSVFPTTSKKNTVHASLDLIKVAKKRLDVPVAVIGGITPDNGKQLIDAGADLLAVISSVYQSSDPYEAVKRFNQLF